MRMKALTCMQRLAPRDFKSSDVLLQRCIEDIHRVMTMRSFVLPPSCWRGWAGPSWGPWAAKGHASRTLAAHAPHTGSVGGCRQSVNSFEGIERGLKVGL